MKDRYHFELLLVDDGSIDDTFGVLKELDLNFKLKVIKLEKNFGHQLALRTGLQESIDSDYVVVLDSDLQDPPHYIEQILNELDLKYPIVLTRRYNREDSIFKKTTAFIYYRFLRIFTRKKFLLDSGDFWGVSNAALKSLLEYQIGKIIFFRGQLIMLDLPYSVVRISRSKRRNGDSKYGISKMMRLALSGMFCTDENTSTKIFTKSIIIFLLITLLVFIPIIMISPANIYTNLGLTCSISAFITLSFMSALRQEYRKQSCTVKYIKIDFNDDKQI